MTTRRPRQACDGPARGSAAALCASLLAACGPTVDPSFDSPEPAARNAAIVEAVRSGDRAAIPDLVRMLESDDPATRVLAIRALERLTGRTLDYEATADELARAGAVRRWREHAGMETPPRTP
ncbi:MAG TPA: HEAT repeat domain-containing protein [Phycisphaerales bacterium]|nr:HEAT repeat domain-containing protein [Phycisphaerales bacterium]